MGIGNERIPDPNHVPDCPDYSEEDILTEQVKQVYTLAPLGFLATFLNSLLVFFILEDVFSYIVLVPWLASIWLITVLRMGLVICFRSAKRQPGFAAKWKARFLAGLVLVGIAWGAIGLLPFSEVSLAHQVFIAFVLGGMAAGASSTFSMLKTGFQAFSIPALAPLTLHFILMNGTFHYAMAAMVALFGTLLWRISRHNYSIHRTSLLLRFENIGMIECLKQAKERVERLNSQLSAEVEAKHRVEEDLRAHHEQLERLVEERTANLTAVNKDLEQFAYVASHDLQEPLRMVVSYLQILKRKYMGRLDEKADMYIRFAVEGGIRMQKLIDGLLSYSRLSRSELITPVDMNAVFAAVVANLAQVITESQAEVTKSELPVLPGDEIQLQQLLQNLISNSLKYRKPDALPRIHVSAEKHDGEWVFSVQDNGIGIDAVHFERIFQIFQRLHTRDEYPGTGIGLASCKKIVERHGGSIWVDSTPGEGSVFFFTIPDQRVH